MTKDKVLASFCDIHKMKKCDGRDTTIDIVKGIGIVLMVLRHARAPYSDFVLLFHMAIFFIASGWLLNCGYSESFSGLVVFIKKKIKGIWVPYFGYTCAFILLNNFFLYINIYTDNPEFLNQSILEAEFVGLGHALGAGEMLTQIAKAIFLGQELRPEERYGFL